MLNLAYTSFDQDLSYLEKLMNLDLRGVNLDNWNDVNFPPRIHELNLEVTLDFFPGNTIGILRVSG